MNKYFSSNNAINLIHNIFKKYEIDLSIDNKGKIGKKKIEVECKLDWFAEKSNLLGFNKNNLDKTKANLWCQVILDFGNPTVWLTSTKKLTEYIKNHKPIKIIENIKQETTNIYLFRDFEILDSIFHRIDIIEELEFKRIIKELLCV